MTRFDFAAYRAATVTLVGCGGLGTNTGLALARKGIDRLVLLDGDTVETKNLTRQLFFWNDVGRNKALRLAKHLTRHGVFPTRIQAFPYYFDEALEKGFDFSDSSALACLVDNNPTRVELARYGLTHKIPIIYAAVSRDANQLYCAIQEPGKACFGCMLPHAVNNETYPCNLPGIIDVLQVAAGLTAYALDTVLGGQYRSWNLKAVDLTGTLPERSVQIPKKDGCPLCGKN